MVKPDQKVNMNNSFAPPPGNDFTPNNQPLKIIIMYGSTLEEILTLNILFQEVGLNSSAPVVLPLDFVTLSQ